jgi:hypothetical protein
VVFRWNSIPGATAYQIRVLLFNFAVIDTITTDTFFVSNTRAIRQLREHNWEVRAINGGNLCTPYGSRNTFFATNYINTTSVSENNWSAMKVYPNPIRLGEKLLISLPENEASTQLTLRDLQGRMVYQTTATADESQLELPATLSPGLYLLDAQSGSRRSFARIHLMP